MRCFEFDNEAKATDAVLLDVDKERRRQESLRLMGRFPSTCASSSMSDFHKLAVLAEEFGEVAQHLAEESINPKRRNVPALRQELIQVAAVAVAWCESLDEIFEKP